MAKDKLLLDEIRKEIESMGLSVEDEDFDLIAGAKKKMKKNPFLHENAGRRTLKGAQKEGRLPRMAAYAAPQDYLMSATIIQLVQMGSEAARAELARRGRDADGVKLAWKKDGKFDSAKWKAKKGMAANNNPYDPTAVRYALVPASYDYSDPTAVMTALARENAGRRKLKGVQRPGRPAPYEAPRGPKVGQLAQVHDTDLRGMSARQIEELASHVDAEIAQILRGEIDRRERVFGGRKKNEPEWLKGWREKKGKKAANNPRRGSL